MLFNNIEVLKALAIFLKSLWLCSQGNIQTQRFGNDITLAQQFDVFNRLT